jgi:TfoX/Sxy family transcriptional regulator of competence genes
MADDPRVIALREVVQRVVDKLDGVERRKVLGSDAWFTRGSLFTLVSRQAKIVVRLADEAAQDELLAIPGAALWRIGKKAPMRSWLELPEAMHDDKKALAAWLKRAWALAPDAKKKPVRKKGGPSR